MSARHSKRAVSQMGLQRGEVALELGAADQLLAPHASLSLSLWAKDGQKESTESETETKTVGDTAGLRHTGGWPTHGHSNRAGWKSPVGRHLLVCRHCHPYITPCWQRDRIHRQRQRPCPLMLTPVQNNGKAKVLHLQSPPPPQHPYQTAFPHSHPKQLPQNSPSETPHHIYYIYLFFLILFLFPPFLAISPERYVLSNLEFLT